jgi:Rod binding domain-containing protein
MDIKNSIPIPSQKSIDLNNKTIDDKKYIPKKFRDVAEGMEQNFAEFMINQMNKSIPTSESEDSAGMDYYKSLQVTEQAKILSQKNNLGLQDVILDQIYPKRLRNELALKQYEAQVDKINHNLPKLEASRKNDTIILGRNESAPLSGLEAKAQKTNEGGLE